MSVSTNEEVVIKDACILFDLIDLGQLANFYQLKLTVFTTPQVIDEIQDGNQLAQVERYIKNGKLQIDQFGIFETIVNITNANPGLSFTDASVLEAAVRRNAVVLSSDKSLRNETRRKSLVVRGLLWILEELFLQKVIHLNVLLEKLKEYPLINKRAPIKEITALISKYTQSI